MAKSTQKSTTIEKTVNAEKAEIGARKHIKNFPPCFKHRQERREKGRLKWHRVLVVVVE